ncbi:MAG: hypothetical protein ACK505_12395 [Flavobacteriales bacterium]|jgi:hypothetical protein
MENIDTRFAFIQHGDQFFQVLKYDEEGNPIDWDEQATAQLYKKYIETNG